MDEKVEHPEPPEDGSDDAERAGSLSAGRLAARLTELRTQLEVLAPLDEVGGREMTERIREAQERIATLELMLARAREREDGLTTQTIRDQTTITECEARIAKLGAVAAGVAASEAARREAEALAAQTERRMSIAQAEVQSKQAEIERLRSRCSELEADLRRLGGEVAAAAVARAEASRLVRERNEARDRAYSERRLAAEDRRLAAEADLHAADLQKQLRAAELRLAKLANERGAREAEQEIPPKVLEPAGTAPPWIELQRATSAAAVPLAADTPGQEPAGDADVIDLTDEQPSSVDPDATDGSPGPEDDPAAAGGSPRSVLGRVGRLLSGRPATKTDRGQPSGAA